MRDVYFRIKLAVSEIHKAYNEEKMSQSSELSEHMHILHHIKDILSDTKATKSFSYDQWLQVWEQFKFALKGGSSKVARASIA